MEGHVVVNEDNGVVEGVNVLDGFRRDIEADCVVDEAILSKMAENGKAAHGASIDSNKEVAKVEAINNVEGSITVEIEDSIEIGNIIEGRDKNVNIKNIVRILEGLKKTVKSLLLKSLIIKIIEEAVERLEANIQIQAEKDIETYLEIDDEEAGIFQDGHNKKAVNDI